MDNLVETMTAEFREKVGDDRVILALSGGVDSSVVAALGARAVGKQMTCVFINHGLLRKGEPEQVEESSPNSLTSTLSTSTPRTVMPSFWPA